jgi:dUTP pyrophosphatase
MLEKGAFPPIREHVTDAGMDIRAFQSGIVKAGQSMTFRTGVHVELPPRHAGLFVSKSGLMINHNITSTGLVDEGYDGEVMVKLFNHGKEDYFVNRGDKIGQLVIMPVLYTPVEIVDSIKGGDRGSNGFGSTDRSKYYAKGAGA